MVFGTVFGDVFGDVFGSGTTPTPSNEAYAPEYYCVGGICDVPSALDVRDGVTYGGSLVGVLELPTEINVLDGVGYGANGIEYVGTLEIGMLLPNSPVVNGRLRTLWTHVDYVTQYGNGFAWVVDTSFDPSTGTAFFRGKLQQCECALDYAWEVEHLNIVAVTGGYEFQFDLLEVDSPDTTGRYDWWLVWESPTAEQIILRSGSVNWVCG